MLLRTLITQWNGGWPMTNSDVDFSSDSDYISNLAGRAYVAAVSPWFFNVSRSRYVDVMRPPITFSFDNTIVPKLSTRISSIEPTIGSTLRNGGIDFQQGQHRHRRGTYIYQEPILPADHFASCRLLHGTVSYLAAVSPKQRLISGFQTTENNTILAQLKALNLTLKHGLTGLTIKVYIPIVPRLHEV
jgi:hypothetical protein